MNERTVEKFSAQVEVGGSLYVGSNKDLEPNIENQPMMQNDCQAEKMPQ